jgi:hypothetical protein
MRPAPVGVTLLVLADQHAETHAGLAVTLVASWWKPRISASTFWARAGVEAMATMPEIPTASAMAVINGFKIIVSPVRFSPAQG